MPIKTVSFPETASRNQSKVERIPNLTSVTRVTVDTGIVTFSVAGENVTINCSNGAYSRYEPYTPSMYVTDSRTGSSENFADSISYSSGSYSGTLYKNGSAVQTGGSYTPAATKTGYYSEGQTGCADWQWNGSSWVAQGGTYFNSYGPGYSYSDGFGYSGTIPFTGISGAYGSARPTYNGTSVGQTATTCNGYRSVNYSGTVTKPATDTRTWRQDYSGYAYGSTSYTYYYKYNVTIEYIDRSRKGSLFLKTANVNLELPLYDPSVGMSGINQLRIAKDGTIACVELVDLNHAKASPIRISTSNGVKAIAKL
jgi:hypothetical protein